MGFPEESINLPRYFAGGKLMECKVKNEYGTIYIAEDVMLKVVGYAALECYGIVAMSGQRATDGIVEWLGRENLTKGVQIRNVGDMLDVDLYIIVEYGIFRTVENHTVRKWGMVQ